MSFKAPSFGRAALPPAPKKSPVEATHASQDWQTAYVWAFIVKFHGNLVGKAGLSTVMDLEIALMASGEDDVLSFVFQKMINALRDGSIRDMKKETMPKHLLRTIDLFIPQPPWSLYHDLPRSRDSTDYRSVLQMSAYEADVYHLGLNPLRAAMNDAALDEGGVSLKEGQKGWDEEAGRMLWRLDWKDKLRLLRQLVDWQLVHSGAVRQTIAECYNIAHQKPMDFKKATNRLIVEPIAQDRTKKRFWSLDDSPRIYTSTNPFKKNCPFTPTASSKDELLELAAELREANDYHQPPPAADGSALAPVDLLGPSPAKKKVKVEKKDKHSKQHDGEIKIIRFIEEEHLPRVEKEIIRQEAARKKAHKAALMQAQAESYSMRTTRTRKVVDYKALDNGTAYGGVSFSDDDRGNGHSDDGAYSNDGSEGSGRRRSDRQMAARATGSRRSTRVHLRDEEEDIQEAMRQSAREAEMDRVMRGEPSASAGDDDDEGSDDDDDDDEGGGEEDDEEVPGGIRPKRVIALESDDEDDDAESAPVTTDGGDVKSNGTASVTPADAPTRDDSVNALAANGAGAMDVDEAEV